MYVALAARQSNFRNSVFDRDVLSIFHRDVNHRLYYRTVVEPPLVVRFVPAFERFNSVA